MDYEVSRSASPAVLRSILLRRTFFHQWAQSPQPGSDAWFLLSSCVHCDRVRGRRPAPPLPGRPGKATRLGDAPQDSQRYWYGTHTSMHITSLFSHQCAAKGCKFLHSTSPPVMHRDLKTPNVLLANVSPDAEVVAKVCDFGVSLMASAQASGRCVDCPGMSTLRTGSKASFHL